MARTFKYFLLTIFLAASFFLTDAAHAQLSATVQADIDFGNSESPAGGAGTNSIGTDGTISYGTGNTGLGTGTAGRILINGTVGRNTRISCETSKTARNSGGSSGSQDETMPAFYLVLGTSSAAGPGSGAVCNGLGSVIINTSLPSAAADRTLLIGADFITNNVQVGGEYALSNHPSGELTIRIRQQGGGPPVEINITLDAKASFVRPITLTAQTEADFGLVEFSGTPGAGDRADLGTDGSIAYGGSFAGSGSGTAGSALISGPANWTILSVYCDQTATLTNSTGSSSITMNNIEAVREAARGSYGSGNACNGLGGSPAFSYFFINGFRDEVFIGGRLDGATAAGSISGTMSTTNPGGDPVDVVIVVP